MSQIPACTARLILVQLNRFTIQLTFKSEVSQLRCMPNQYRMLQHLVDAELFLALNPLLKHMCSLLFEKKVCG